MAKNFFNGSDAELNAGTQNFSTKISATPTAYGLSASQATAYAALSTAFTAAYTTAITPETRTRGTVAAKNAAKIPLKVMAGDLAKIINATPSVTNQQKIDLGLHVRAVPTPIPQPAVPPVLEVTNRIGTVVTIRLHDGTAKRAKPTGVQGARIYSFVGATPPGDINDWNLEWRELDTRSRCMIWIGSVQRSAFSIQPLNLRHVCHARVLMSMTNGRMLMGT
jgi:hypothetical protein